MKYYFFSFQTWVRTCCQRYCNLGSKEKENCNIEYIFEGNFFPPSSQTKKRSIQSVLKTNKFDNWLKSRNNKWNFDPFPNMVKTETYFSDLWAVPECFVYLIKIAPKSLLKRNKAREFPFTHQYDQKQVMMTYHCLKQCMITLMYNIEGDCDSDIIWCMAPFQNMSDRHF